MHRTDFPVGVGLGREAPVPLERLGVRLRKRERALHVLAEPAHRDLACPGHPAVDEASQGIGAGIARSLSAQGARVVLAARSEDKLADLAEELRAQRGEALPYALDVRNAVRDDDLVYQRASHELLERDDVDPALRARILEMMRAGSDAPVYDTLTPDDVPGEIDLRFADQVVVRRRPSSSSRRRIARSAEKTRHD